MKLNSSYLSDDMIKALLFWPY